MISSDRGDRSDRNQTVVSRGELNSVLTGGLHWTRKRVHHSWRSRRVQPLALFAVAAAVAVIVAATPPARLSWLLGAGLGVAVVILVSLRWGLLGFLTLMLVVRPIFDLAADQSLGDVAGTVSADSAAKLNPAALLSLLVIAVCPLMLLRAHRARQIPKLPVPLILYLVLIAYAVMSIGFSENRSLAAADALRLLSIASMGLTVLLWATRARSPLPIFRAVSFSSVIPCLLAVRQGLTSSGNQMNTTGVNRVVGSTPMPNAFAHYLVMCLLATLLLVVFETRGRIVFGLLGLLQGVSLVLTFTLGAWAATLTAGVVLILTGTLRRVPPGLVVMVIGLAVAVALNASILQYRLNNVFLADTQLNSGYSRLLLWEDRVTFLSQRPDVLVRGLAIGGSLLLAEQSRIENVPHNDHLRVLLELGVGGLLVWLGIFASGAVILIRRLLQIRHLAPKGPDRLLCSIGLATLSAYLLGGSVENLFTTTIYQWYWWTLVVMSLASAYGLIGVMIDIPRHEDAGRAGLPRGFAYPDTR